jgi:MFS family permease
MSTTISSAGAGVAQEPRSGGGFFAKFTVLKGATRELWLVFAIKLLGFAAYGVTNYTLPLWLSEQFGYGDQKALALVLGWSLSMTVFTLLVGSLTDAIGFRKTFFLGVGMCLLARAVLAFTNSIGLAIVGGLFPLAIGEALGNPVLVASVQRYANTRQRSMGFAVIYLMGNVGLMLAGFVFDWVRRGLGEHGHMALPLGGMTITSYQTLLLVAVGLELAIVPLLFFLRSNVEATDAGMKAIPVVHKHNGQGLWKSFRISARESLRETARLFAGLVRQDGFYRLLGFLMLVALLKLIFMQMYYVYPKFGIRELGDGAPVGQLWALNSILIIPLVPLVGALTQRWPAYRMVTIGAIISAASVFFMALPTNWFTAMANGLPGDWIGHRYLGLKGAIHPYYVMIALYVVVLSIGEAFYSPRVYEYAAAIAPKGQEASYGALSYVPFLLAKIIVLTLSAALLARYCPEHGERHSGTMWLFVALTASIAPIGLIALRRYIRVREAGRE